MMLQSLALTLLCSAVLVLQGCSAWQVNQAAASLAVAGPQATLDRLQTLVPADRDLAQYRLNTGVLKLYLGDWQGSRQDLNEAKSILQFAQAVSVTENLAALTANETLRTYNGTPTDQVLVHVMLALGYLLEGDLDGARVEMLQANVTMQQLAKEDSTAGQLASARFMAGLIYELNGERDDALISYRRCYSILRDRGEPIPQALQTSLLNLTRRQGFQQEYQQFSQQFGREAQLPAADEGEWFLVYLDGVVSSKTETRISVFDAEVDTMVSVVMPHYRNSTYLPRELTLAGEVQRQRSNILENLEVRAREDLEAERAKILAAATVRAVAKYKMVQEAQSKNDFSGILMNIATVVSEQADVRSWNMLPASIQVARITTSLQGPVQVLEKGQALPPLAEFSRRGRAVVLASSLTDQVYVWPALPEPPESGETHAAQ
ncbi:hypothetical protein [Ketobacter sp.]|uniref:hypothetical protein n=1 Tax=Ketobacter sp. TaxID=2083498 RepID=UPI000F190337|nr:hypothetical protein [Ketobacter sp.]RLU00685.1 MAG: hypothetical protein D9N14_05300 [Ketobacter sp.]